MDKYFAKLKNVYHQIDQMLGSALSILVESAQTFGNAHAPEAAASIAFYSLFSIFPLLLFVAAFASSFLEDDAIQNLIFQFVQESLPSDFQDLILTNIEQAMASRGTIQIISMVGLLWAASAVFTVITHNIDRAWKVAPERNFIFGRLVGLGMIGVITLSLVVLWILSTTLVNLLPLLEIPLWNGQSIQVYDTYVWSIGSSLIPWFLIFVALLGIYRWVPNTSVRWREAVWGATFGAIGWELAQRGFGWYLTSGFASYRLVYGSLGAVIAFMIWLYVTALVVLYGAHLSAAVAFYRRGDRKAELENKGAAS
jgi:membrane protein